MAIRKRYLFENIWADEDEYYEEYSNNPLYLTEINEATHKEIFLLLLGKYGMAEIACDNVDHFKLRLFGILYEYAPTWKKNMDLQKEARQLTTDQAREGTLAIHNTAKNPSQGPSSQASDPLPYLDAQSASVYKKGKIDTILQLSDILNANYTKIFLDKFKELFSLIINTGDNYGI